MNTYEIKFTYFSAPQELGRNPRRMEPVRTYVEAEDRIQAVKILKSQVNFKITIIDVIKVSVDEVT